MQIKLYTKSGGFTTPRRKKLPPFGKRFAERILSGPPPFIVKILVHGQPNYPWQVMPDPWKAAKAINERNDSFALILPNGEPPSRLKWNVRGLICSVQHWPSRGMDGVISELVKCLRDSGAEYIIVRDSYYGCTRGIFW